MPFLHAVFAFTMFGVCMCIFMQFLGPIITDTIPMAASWPNGCKRLFEAHKSFDAFYSWSQTVSVLPLLYAIL